MSVTADSLIMASVGGLYLKGESMISYSSEEVEDQRQQALADADNKNSYPPHSMGYHEAFHTSYVMLEMFDRYVLDHIAVVQDRDIYHQAHAIHTAMYNLYQAMGSKHL